MWRVDSLEKTLMLGRVGGRRRRGWQRMRWMDGWHHQLDGDEFGWTPGVGDRQGGLACCSSWGCKESDTTEPLNWTEQSPSGVILEPPKWKSVTVSIVFPTVCHEVMGPDAMILVFWMLSFKPTFSLSSFTFMHWRRKQQLTPVFLPGESQELGSLGGLPSMEYHRVRHDWSDLAAAAVAAGSWW